MGFLNFRERASLFRRIETEEKAAQVLDSMTLQWNLRDQIIRLSALIKADLGRIFQEKSWGGSGPSYGASTFAAHASIESVACHHLEKPFPGNVFFGFRFGGKEGMTASGALVPPALVFSSKPLRGSRRSLEFGFQYLVSRALKIPLASLDSRRGKKTLQVIFGDSFPAEVQGDFQRGLPTRVVYRRKIHILLWDVIMSRGKIYGGFMVLIPESRSSVKAGFQLAMDSAVDNRVSSLGVSDRGPEKVIPAFLRVHPSQVGSVLPTVLRKSRAFKRWLSGFWLELRSAPVEFVGFPNGVEIGKWSLFSRIAINSTHCAVVLVKTPSAIPFPLWITSLFVLVSCGWIVILARGFLLGRWPAMKLRSRFMAQFLLAASVPISMLVISAVSFNQEKEESILRDLRGTLKARLEKIDMVKEETKTRYQAVFFKLTRDPFLLSLLGDAKPDPEKTLDYCRKAFDKASLPLSLIAFFDIRGRNYCRFEEEGSNDVRGLVDFLRIMFVTFMRERLGKGQNRFLTGPDPLSVEDHAVYSTYDQTTHGSILETAEHRRTLAEMVHSGRTNFYKIHEFLAPRGVEDVVMLVGWVLSALDAETIRQSASDFLSDQPRGEIAAFKIKDSRLTRVFPEGETGEAYPLLRSVAVHASKRGGLSWEKVTFSGQEWLGAARPMDSMSDTVIAVGLPLAVRSMGFWRARRTITLGLILALLIILGLAAFTRNRLVPAVEKIKLGLDTIASGEFETKLALRREDELGMLSTAFDEMAEGVAHRLRLLKLVSGKARELLDQGGMASTGSTVTRVRAVVLVSDIRGFTTKCEQEKPGTITSLLNNHFDRMVPIVLEHGGKIEKFVGDALFGVFESSGEEDPSPAAPAGECFGNPSPAAPAGECFGNPTHPPHGNGHPPGDSAEIRAFRCGLAILETVGEISRERVARGVFPYDVGVGLSCGELLLGNVGDPRFRFEPAYLGLPMKEAANLESLSKNVPWLPMVIQPGMKDALGKPGEGLVPLEGHEVAAMVFPRDFVKGNRGGIS